MIRYYITDSQRGDVCIFAQRAIRDGIEMIQIRERHRSTRDLFELVCRIRDMAAGSRTRLLVNDRLDVALAADIDGVHLPDNGLPADRVRPLISLLGMSTHSLEESTQAETAGADFIVFGPVFETPGKSPVGLDALAEVAHAVRIPVLAIGGMTLENARRATDRGAAGIAAIRLFQRESPRP